MNAIHNVMTLNIDLEYWVKVNKTVSYPKFYSSKLGKTCKMVIKLSHSNTKQKLIQMYSKLKIRHPPFGRMGVMISNRPNYLHILSKVLVIKGGMYTELL